MTQYALILAGLTLPAGSARPDPLPTPEFLFAAFADNQQRLRSGIVRMEGTVTSRSAAGNGLEGPARLFCAFDIDANLFRFDRSEPVRPLPTDVTNTPPSGAKSVTGGGKYAQTPKRVVIWNEANPKQVRMAPVGLPAGQTAPAIFPFDPRILGLANWVIVKHGESADTLVPSFGKRFSKTKHAVTEPRPGVIRVRWTERDGGLEIDFDRDVGYMPIRYADFTMPERGKPAEPYDSAVTTWQSKGGAYVPVTARFQDAPNDDPELSRYDFKLTWQTVNGPVDEKLATARGMDLPAGVQIVDNTASTQGTVLGKVGDLKPDPRLAYVESNPVPAPQPPPLESQRGWVWPVVGTAAAAGLAVVVLWRRRVSHR